MITIPQLKPAAIKNMEVDFGTSIATGLWQRIAQQLNWIEKNMPIGMVIWFYDSMTYAGGPNVPDPKATNWQFCDGSAITNPNSPMFGQNTPDLRGLYQKGSNIVAPFTLTGVPSINLSHNHGGSTGITCDLEGNNDTDDSDEKPAGNCHSHSVSGALGVYTLDPPHVELQPYMRIA